MLMRKPTRPITGKEPCSEAKVQSSDSPRRLTKSLQTPEQVVEKLQRTLHAKAKAELSYRFYSLWDKVCRREILQVAYAQCRCNGGAAARKEICVGLNIVCRASKYCLLL